MTEPTSPSDRMLAEIRDWAATLPSRCPTVLRVAPGAQDELKRAAEPAVDNWVSGRLPLGVTVVEDATYPPGQWRIFDQWDKEISAGVLPVVGATVSVDLGDGNRKNMRVIAVRRHGQGQIVDYTVIDPPVLEMQPTTDRLFPAHLPGRWAW